MVREGWVDAEVAAYPEHYMQPLDVTYLKIPLIDIDIMAFTWSWYLFATRFADRTRRVRFQQPINALVLPSDLPHEGASQQAAEEILL
jgi:hypothetical protein